MAPFRLRVSLGSRPVYLPQPTFRDLRGHDVLLLERLESPSAFDLLQFEDCCVFGAVCAQVAAGRISADVGSQLTSLPQLQPDS